MVTVHVWSAVLVLVHGDEHRGGLEELHLLVLGDEEFRGEGPFGGMFPSGVGMR